MQSHPPTFHIVEEIFIEQSANLQRDIQTYFTENYHVLFNKLHANSYQNETAFENAASIVILKISIHIHH